MKAITDLNIGEAAKVLADVASNNRLSWVSLSWWAVWGSKRCQFVETRQASSGKELLKVVGKQPDDFTIVVSEDWPEAYDAHRSLWKS
jgi:hypothetical protein